MNVIEKASENKLTALRVHQPAVVAAIETQDQRKLEKLMAMGVFPGMTIMLIRKFPSYVFQVGQSQFTVDKELAECIFVSEREGSAGQDKSQ